MKEEIQMYKDNGFSGFKSVDSLLNDKSILPEVPGVYIVIRDQKTAPVFLKIGTGGFYKREDPNVEISTLQANWVETSKIVYIGKATSLKKRIGQLLSFGDGKDVGHRGGRYLWQLADSRDLLIAWKPTPNEIPRKVEERMIQEFKSAHGGMRPFANLQD